MHYSDLVHFTPMNRKVIGAACVLAGGIAATVWLSGRARSPFLPFIALILIFVGANFFSKISELSERMRSLIGKKVRIQIWGSALKYEGTEVFVLLSVSAIGAGLHIYLSPMPKGSPKHLKIAQPRGATLDKKSVGVGDAKYIQWEGRMTNKLKNEKAFALRLEK